MHSIGLITGLQSECALVPISEQVIPKCFGPGREQAAKAAQTACEAGADRLISFGICGALNRTLSTGEVLCPEVIRFEGGSDLAVDPVWRNQLPESLFTRVGSLISTSSPICTPPEKAAMASQADAVDMESYGVAEVAAANGLPFLALRAVSDDADQTVPTSALAGMRPDGQNSALKTVLSLLTRPGEFGPLMRTARDYTIAIDALGSVAGAAGTRFWIAV